MSGLPFLDADTVNRIREIDLLTYLEHAAPDDLFKRSTEYRLRSHPRFAISHGKWYDFEREIGGVSALDYYVKIHGMLFLEAAHMILAQGLPSIRLPTPPAKEPKAFELPARNHGNEAVCAYLRGRGIHSNIIFRAVAAGCLYESRDYHNCVFVGFDAERVPRYAFLRGTMGDFRMDVEGSMKRYGFVLPSSRKSHAVGVFESPIDALSYATLYPDEDTHRLSLGGTSSGALMQFIADHPEIRTVCACLDNDEAGQRATEKLRAMLPSEYIFVIRPPPEGKDYNEYLQIRQRRARENSRPSALFR